MAINIEVIRVDVESKGKYQVATVAYKGPDGKVDAKKLVSFANKAVYDLLKEAQSGDLFEVTSEKDTNGYWQWTSATAVGKNTGGSSAPAGKVAQARSNFETPEERAARQVYIVRQSSVSNAIAFHTAVKDKVTIDDVLKTAKAIEQYVFAGPDLPSEPEIA